MIISSAQDITDSLGLTLNGTSLAEKAFAHAKRAERYLRGRVTDAVYDAAENTSDDNHETLKSAEAMLAVSYALPFVNLRVTETGGLTKVIGLNDLESREELLTPRAVDRLRHQLKAEADELTAHLVPVPSDDADVDQVEAGRFSLFSVKGEEAAGW